MLCVFKPVFGNVKTTDPNLGMEGIPEGERPRERLLRHGSGSLSDSELIAVLLGTGTREVPVLQLARQVLQAQGGSLRGLVRLPVERLLGFPGIGPAKAVLVAAALEIGKRIASGPSVHRPRILQSADADRVLRPQISGLGHEEFWVLYLNNANAVLARFQLSKGGLTGTLVDVRLLLRKALEVGAVALVLAHNHPSGNLKPSQADLQITRKIKKAAATMDIRVLDHLILGESAYFSFADEQLL